MHKNQEMYIAILGTPVKCGNRGVLALGSSLISLCKYHVSTAEPVLLVGNRDAEPMSSLYLGKINKTHVVNFRLSLKSNIQEHLAMIFLLSLFYRLIPFSWVRKQIESCNPWIRTLVAARFVGDIRGGDSFSDIYGMQVFFTGFVTALTALLVKGSIVQFPQTYGPYNSTIAKVLARYLLTKSPVIIARDRSSQMIAQELIGSDKKVWLSPDVAFSLESKLPDQILLDNREAPAKTGPILGVNINGLMYNGGFTRNNMFGLKLDYPTFLNSLIRHLLEKENHEIWLIPHTFAPLGHVESDIEASLRTRDSLPQDAAKRVRIVTRDYDQHEIKGIIGQCDFFIGSRMHACIAALSQGIPCIGIAYSMKFSGVFETVRMQEWIIDGRTSSNEEALIKVSELYKSRDQIRPQLITAVQAAQHRLHEVFARLFSDTNFTKDPLINIMDN